MKLTIALACLLALAYAAEEAKPADNSADLAVDEHRWGGYYGGYGHYNRPHYYGHYRGRRSVETVAPAEESDQSVDEHRYRGWGGHYRGWGGYAPYYGGYYGHYRGRRSAEEDQSAVEHRYRGWGGYYRPHHYGGYYRPYWG